MAGSKTSRLARCLAVFAIFSASAIIADPVYEQMPSGDLKWYDMNLKNGNPSGGDLRMLVQTVGDSITIVAFASGAVRYRDWDGITLKKEGDRILGRQRVHDTKFEFYLEMDVTNASGTLSGDYTFDRTDMVENDGTIKSESDLSGSVAGIVTAENELLSSNAMPNEALWDSYIGPNQNYSSCRSGVSLVGDMHEMELVWVSEFIGGMQIGDCRHGCRMYGPVVGGPSTPLLCNGKIYQMHLYPAGDRIQKCFEERSDEKTRAFVENTGRTPAQGMRRFAVQADEYMTSIDAATGKTVWKTKYPFGGLNFVGHKNAFTNHTGCIGDGVVYMFSTLGLVRALDAETGRELWTKEIPGYYQVMQGHLSSGLSTGEPNPHSRQYAHGLNYIGGVVIVPTGIADCALAGLDARTGAVLWQDKGGLGACSTPIRWKHGDKEYIITADASGDAYCLDPATGNEIWKESHCGDNQYQISIEGDYLLTYAGCYLIGMDGLKKLWEIDPIACSRGSRPTGLLYNNIAWLRCDKQLEARDIAGGESLFTDVFTTKGEAWTFGAEGKLFVNHESQHKGSHHFSLFWANQHDWNSPGGRWYPPHYVDLTYAIPVMYPTANGRIFMRSGDAIYCYDLRTPKPKPTVILDSPQNNETADAGSEITLRASVRNAEATRVTFYADGEKIGEKGQAPYELTWTAWERGAHLLSATATEGDGYESQSNNVRILVVQPPCTASPGSPPSLSSPEDNSATSVFVHLDWEATTFGENAPSGYIVRLGTTQPPSVIDTVKTYKVTGLWAGELESSKDYYWRVDAFNDCGVTEGPIRRFSTIPFEGFRHLRFDAYKDGSFEARIQEVEWLDADGGAYPNPKLSSANDQGGTVTEAGGGKGDAYRLYDGSDEPWKLNSRARATLDLGEGNGVYPTQVTVKVDAGRKIDQAWFYGSTDREEWVLLGEYYWPDDKSETSFDLSPIGLEGDDPAVDAAAQTPSLAAADVRNSIRIHPSRSAITINASKSGKAKIELFDTRGRRMLSVSRYLFAGESALISLAGIDAAAHMLIWRAVVDGKTFSGRFSTGD